MYLSHIKEALIDSQISLLSLKAGSGTKREHVFTLTIANFSMVKLNLHTYDLTEQEFVQMIRQCLNLREISFSLSIGVTDFCLLTIAVQLPSLTKLDFRHCGSITDQGLLSVAEHCSSLQHVSMFNSVEITDISLIKLAQNCHHLCNIDIGGCYQVTDAFLLALAENCSQLNSLFVEHCELISDVGLCTLVKKCSKLSEFYMGNSKITDKTLFAIAEHCMQLHTLAISQRLDISEGCIDAVVQRCKGLRNLIVCNKQVTAVLLASWKVACPLLEIYFL